jgi:hypothetical protein
VRPRARRRAARRIRQAARAAGLSLVALAFGLILAVALGATAVHHVVIEPLRGLAHLIGATS